MRTLTVLLYASAAALGTYQTFRPTFDSGFASVQTERGDGMLNHYLLENSWLALSDPGYRGTLVTPPFCFPERGTIYYSENLWGTAPLYWALRLVLPCDLAYPWWQIVLAVLNFVTFALVARRLGLSHLLAAGGAFLWAFAMVHADQIKHQQMIPRLWMPVAAYYAVALTAGPSLRSLNRLLGSTFLQCLCCFYTGWFLVMGLAVFLPALVALRPGAARELWRFVAGRPLAVAGVVAFWALAMAALFGPYMVFSPSSGHEYEGCYNFLPTPAAWLTGPEGSRWEAALSGYSRPFLIECRLFSGFGVYALMLAAAVGLPLARRAENPLLWRLTAAGLLTAAVWWVLTISTAHDGDSLWRWVRHLPGGKAVRVVSRVYVIVYLFGTLAGLAWLQAVTERIRRERVRLAVRAVVVAALAWEQTGVEMPSFERDNFYPLVDRVADDLRGAEAGYVAPYYIDRKGSIERGPYGEVFAMWAGLRANVPVVNGYSGVLPPGMHPFETMTDEQIRAWLSGRYHGTVRVVDWSKPGVRREVVVE